jgi:hypothetical protein
MITRIQLTRPTLGNLALDLADLKQRVQAMTPLPFQLCRPGPGQTCYAVGSEEVLVYVKLSA